MFSSLGMGRSGEEMSIRRPWSEMMSDEDNAAVGRLMDDFLDNPLTLASIQSKLILTLRPRNEDAGVIRRPLLNTDVTVCMKLEKDFQVGIFGIRPELARYFNVSEETLIEAAAKNTRKSLIVKGMTSMLMGYSDDSEDDSEELFDDNELMFVCTTKDKLHGAVALYYPEVFKSFCEKQRFPGIYIIPSSVHELILVPTFSLNPDDLAQMVLQINETVVNENLRLEPVVYEYRQRTNEVTIAAQANPMPELDPMQIAGTFIGL